MSTVSFEDMSTEMLLEDPSMEMMELGDSKYCSVLTLSALCIAFRNY